MAKEKFFRVHVEAIQSVVLIKVLSAKQQKVVYDTIKKKISGISTHIVATSFYRDVLRHTLKDYNKFIQKVNGGKEETKEYQEIIRIVYKHVMEFYPSLSLNIICFDLDSSNLIMFKDDIGIESFVDIYVEII